MAQTLFERWARAGTRRDQAVNHMVEMFVHKVGMDPMNRALVVLQDADQRRLLPIWIGPFEAQAIHLALSNAPHERPFTHDLLLNAIKGLGYEIERIEVTRLENNTFYAEIIVRGGSGEARAIDSRPSDAIALAVRAQVPVFVAQDVLDRAELLTEEAEQEDMETFRRLMSNLPVGSEGGPTTEGTPSGEHVGRWDLLRPAPGAEAPEEEPAGEDADEAHEADGEETS